MRSHTRSRPPQVLCLFACSSPAVALRTVRSSLALSNPMAVACISMQSRKIEDSNHGQPRSQECMLVQHHHHRSTTHSRCSSVGTASKLLFDMLSRAPTLAPAMEMCCPFHSGGWLHHISQQLHTWHYGPTRRCVRAMVDDWSVSCAWPLAMVVDWSASCAWPLAMQWYHPEWPASSRATNPPLM
jgi:hypothetical protein